MAAANRRINSGGGYGGSNNSGNQGGTYNNNSGSQGGTYNNNSGNQGGTYNNNNNQGTYNNDNYPKKKKRKHQGPYNNGGVYQGQGAQGRPAATTAAESKAAIKRRHQHEQARWWLESSLHR